MARLLRRIAIARWLRRVRVRRRLLCRWRRRDLLGSLLLRGVTCCLLLLLWGILEGAVWNWSLSSGVEGMAVVDGGVEVAGGELLGRVALRSAADGDAVLG